MIDKHATRVHAGAPGLLALQYVVDRITPYTLAAALEQSLRDTLKDMRISQARRLNLKRFDMGTAPPRMLAARAYDVGPEAMAFDVDVQWDSTLVAEIEMVTKPIGARVPVSVRNVRFEGTVRAVLTPLVPGGPGYGAMLLSLPAPPALKMEVRPNPKATPNPSRNRSPSPSPHPNHNPNPNPNPPLTLTLTLTLP